MPLTIEQRDVVVSELKRIGASLNLSDDQKQKAEHIYDRSFRKGPGIQTTESQCNTRGFDQEADRQSCSPSPTSGELPNAGPTQKMGFGSGKRQRIFGAETRCLKRP